MWFRSVLLCAAAAASMTTPASATMRISEDRGGQIGHYLQVFASVRSSGENVVIDGNCLSACTLVLGLVPRSRVCATSRARFGFHAAWMPDVDGTPVTSPLGTQALWNIYPSHVRRWITRNGGLSRKMIYLQGNAMRGIVSDCSEKSQEARAERPSAPAIASRADRRFERRASRSAASQTTRRAIRYSAVSTAGERR